MYMWQERIILLRIIGSFAFDFDVGHDLSKCGITYLQVVHDSVNTFFDCSFKTTSWTASMCWQFSDRSMAIRIW